MSTDVVDEENTACAKPKKRFLPRWLASAAKESENSVLECEGTNQPNNSVCDQLVKNLEELKFPGTIHYYCTVAEASVVCDEIRNIAIKSKHGIALGFDLEWKPPFGPGKESCTAVVQLCYNHFDCHVIHLAAMTGFPRALRLLIEENKVIKVGVAIKNDIRKLGRDFNLPAQTIIDESVVELSDLANSVLHSDQQWGLERLVQHVLKLGLPKKSWIRRGNWNRFPLSEQQLKYAALDAYASFLLYEDLKALEQKTTGGNG